MWHVRSRKWLWFAPLLGALTLAVAQGGCGHSTGSTRPVSAAEQARSVESAVARIVQARCDVEERCNNLGTGERFETRATCESKMQGETASHLNTSDCPLGVEQRKLEACLASIRAQDCGSMFDALSRWNTCRNGQICYQ